MVRLKCNINNILIHMRDLVDLNQSKPVNYQFKTTYVSPSNHVQLVT